MKFVSKVRVNFSSMQHDLLLGEITGGNPDESFSPLSSRDSIANDRLSFPTKSQGRALDRRKKTQGHLQLGQIVIEIRLNDCRGDLLETRG